MSETVASGILTGAVKVSGFVTSSVANSRMGKKLIDLLPGEVVVASLDGFGTFISDTSPLVICWLHVGLFICSINILHLPKSHGDVICMLDQFLRMSS